MRLSNQMLRAVNWQSMDARWAVRWNRLSRYRALRDLFRLFSRLGDGVAWYLLMLALPFAFGTAGLMAAFKMLVAGVAGLVIYRWLKNRTLRPRPFQVVTDIVASSTPLDQFSFPSGHTLHAVCFAMIASAHFPILTPWLATFAILVAMSRPILGLHYPSDVLAGACIGAALAKLALAGM